MSSRERPDAFLIAGLGGVFVVAALLLSAGLFLITGEFGAPVAATGAALSAAGCLGWLLARPWRAQTAAIALVVFIGALMIPRLFMVDGLFLKEAASLQSSRLAIVAGLNVGAIFVVLLCFVAVGFVAPLVGALQKRERGPIVAHAVVVAAAVASVAFLASPLWRDMNFAMAKPARQHVVAAIREGRVELTDDILRAGRKKLAPAARFPRLACCGGVIYVMENGAVLFPMTDFGRGAWGWLHEDGGKIDPRFRTLQEHGKGWRRVSVEWSAR